MGYYNYHAQVKSKIKNGELKSYHFEKDYKNIGFCLMLCFNDKCYPIREKHFEEYFNLIGEYYSTIKDGKNFITIFLN